MADLCTAEQAAAILGLSPRQVREVASNRGLGTRMGARLLVLTAADVEAMRDRRRAGRPRKEVAHASAGKQSRPLVTKKESGELT